MKLQGHENLLLVVTYYHLYGKLVECNYNRNTNRQRNHRLWWQSVTSLG